MGFVFDNPWWIVGLLISILLGYLITKPVIKCVKEDIKVKVMKYLNIEKEDDVSTPWVWWKEIAEFDLVGGRWVGYLDRIIFFLALSLILMTEVEAEGLIVGWLGFKIAAKWESWSNITKVQDQSNASKKEPYFDQVMRRWWGTLVMQRFVIGTGLNFLCAVLGIIATYGLPILFGR